MNILSNHPLIVANWKSHKTREAAVAWFDAYEAWMASHSNLQAQVVVAPPFPALMFAANRLLKPELRQTFLAVQDLSPFPAGAYTGAVSAQNLSGFDVRFAIVGHSERRRYFHETHQEVANKVDQALQAGITPIVCLDDEYLSAQAAAINPDQLKSCIVAYEPLEAIGSGLNQPVAEVAPIVARIKEVFGNVPVIYGGSVEADNVAEYLGVCQGVLVGGASLDVKEFTGLLEKV